MVSATTIRDVARQAKVSVASVSRALNGGAHVHPDTRARVVEAAALLGYVPHAGARSLSTARSNAIGVVLPDLHGEFFSEIVRGLDREASRSGYQLLLSNTHADEARATTALRAMRGRVDAIVAMAPQIDPAVIGASIPDAMPTVLLNTPATRGHHALSVDNRGGAEAMMRHLIKSGRRAIVHVAGNLGNNDARERADGYRTALARHAPDQVPVVVEGDFLEASGAAAVAQLRESGVAFDAVFAGNDMMALGALQALRGAGVDVPGDVAVAGFDDVPLARYLGLTTVSVDMAGMGARAIRLLVAALSGRRDAPVTERIAATLVVRATTQA